MPNQASVTSYVTASQIMGENFFGIREAIAYLAALPDDKEGRIFAEIPWGPEVLESHKKTHLLVAVFPLPILGIYKHTQGTVREHLFPFKPWWNKAPQAFVKNRGQASWELIRKEPLAGSTNKTWREQRKLFLPTEEAPTTQIVVYSVIGHFLKTGERLFPKTYVRCPDKYSGGGNVCVGCFNDERGLSIIGEAFPTRSELTGAITVMKK